MFVLTLHDFLDNKLFTFTNHSIKIIFDIICPFEPLPLNLDQVNPIVVWYNFVNRFIFHPVYIIDNFIIFIFWKDYRGFTPLKHILLFVTSSVFQL